MMAPSSAKKPASRGTKYHGVEEVIDVGAGADPRQLQVTE
jgi:hypothetical protein